MNKRTLLYLLQSLTWLVHVLALQSLLHIIGMHKTVLLHFEVRCIFDILKKTSLLDSLIGLHSISKSSTRPSYFPFMPLTSHSPYSKGFSAVITPLMGCCSQALASCLFPLDVPQFTHSWIDLALYFLILMTFDADCARK